MIDCRDLEEIIDSPVTKQEEAVANRIELEKNIKNMWGHSALGIESEKAAMTMLSTKTGMYAKVPLLCKGEGCPYAESCSLLKHNLAPEGEFCTSETAIIKYNYMKYSEDYDIENASFTDRNIIATIIHYDVMIERVKALIAQEEVPVIDVIAGIADNGETFTRPEISKNIEALERFIKKRNEMYQLMMGTRKDQKGEIQPEKTISQILADASETKFIIDQRPKELE